MSGQYDNLPDDIKDFLKQLHEVAQDSTMYLFGSYARGTAGPDSDVDILLIDRKVPTQRTGRIGDLRALMRGKIKRPYDLLVTDVSEIERRKNDRWWVGYKAVHEGIKIYE
jgi:predicted nucleotidyltransferase